ncbi:hypothetical protein [Novosphingobium aquae]|uniref:Uncharacterized protein n=1 Tax=Novosphingobium aquae TaxID=3133435 RepID=A0ABU8SD98_9SPHN
MHHADALDTGPGNPANGQASSPPNQHPIPRWARAQSNSIQLEVLMKIRAAVVFEAKTPLEMADLELEGCMATGISPSIRSLEVV